ncbi:MAG: hypothetical protein ACERKZ_10040 [Lachnotalea sp.]
MDINGIIKTTSITSITSINTTTSSKNTDSEKATKKSEDTTSHLTEQKSGVIYEKPESTTVKGLYTQNTNLVNQLKSDSDARLNQLQDLVYKLISKQGSVSNNIDDIWSLLQKGDITVDQETADAATEEISEDGYWGVNQTSERIFSFAKALTGGDPSKIDAMQEAFVKGYNEATKAWGKDLPEISSKTYDAVMEKFDAWREESGTSSNTTDAE